MAKDTLSSYAPTRVSIILHQMGWGGVDRVAVILAKGFAERGIETELLVCARGGEGEVTMKDIVGDKVTVHFFRQTSGSRTVDLLLGFL